MLSNFKCHSKNALYGTPTTTDVKVQNTCMMYVHMYCILLSTGPLISSWCMRMEGKNSYCKRIAQSSNFKNVPLTLTYLQNARFFERELECGPGIVQYKTDMVYITGVDFVTAREPKKVSCEEEVVVEKVRIYNEMNTQDLVSEEVFASR